MYFCLIIAFKRLMNTVNRHIALFLTVIFMTSQLVYILHSHSDSTAGTFVDHHADNSGFTLPDHKGTSSKSLGSDHFTHHQCMVCHHFLHHSALGNAQNTDYFYQYVVTFSGVLQFFDSFHILKGKSYSFLMRGPPVRAFIFS